MKKATQLYYNPVIHLISLLMIIAQYFNIQNPNFEDDFMTPQIAIICNPEQSLNCFKLQIMK